MFRLTGASAAEINQVGSGGYSSDRPWVGVNLVSVKGDAGTVDIEPGEYLADRLVQPEDNLCDADI